MQKRGQIWISAVLYMALGVVVLTIILAAGVPLVQKMKDKNTVTQTKNMFFVLDENIRGVLNEGPGAKRYLSPFEIRAGEFYVDADNDKLTWNITTTAKLIEPGIEMSEGAVKMQNYETLLADEYIMNLKLDYAATAKLSLVSDFQNPFAGVYSLSIKNTGTYTDDAQPPANRPIVEITIAG